MTAAAVVGPVTGGRGFIRPELEHLAVPIGTVATYPGNARRGNHPTIRASLTAHGQYKPLLAQRSTGYLVVGNNTVAVMRDMGWTHVAVLHLDLDDDAARRLLLVDNRSSDIAEDDTAALVELLAGLPEFDGSGWTALDLDGLLAEMDGGVALADLPNVEQALPVSPAPQHRPLPPAPTADPFRIPTPPPQAPRYERLPEPPTEPPPPAAVEPPTPPTPVQPRTTVLPPALPPSTRPTPAPTAPSAWTLDLTRADRDEAQRLVGDARQWLDDPHATPADIVLRALRTLAAVGDARHNPTTTLNLTTLLIAAGRDPWTLQ